MCDKLKELFVRLHVAPRYLENNVEQVVEAESLLQRAAGMESEGVPFFTRGSQSGSLFLGHW
jgi:hypothetical protein